MLLANYGQTHDPRTAQKSWTSPIRIDSIEWFATPGELCSLARALKEDGEHAATDAVLDILAMNPGVADARGDFSYVGYKGGSEPGVLNLTWLLRRSIDGAWRFLTVSFNDSSAALDEESAVYVATGARALLAR